MTEILFLVLTLGLSLALIGIIEMILMHSFAKFIFSIGIPIIKITIEIPTNDLYVQFDTTYRKSEGKFRFSSDNKVYFLSKMFFRLKLFRFNTLFPVKAIGIIRPDNKVDITGRLPIGSSLFLFFWLIGCTVGTIGGGIQSKQVSTMGFGLIGWVFILIMISISYLIEKNRMKKMIDELKLIITGDNRI